MKEFILALDQGTTGSRALIFDAKGAVVSIAQREINQYNPRLGWVEHDPEEIWSSQWAVALEALEKSRVTSREIAAIGITNQRETALVWDRNFASLLPRHHDFLHSFIHERPAGQTI